mmetsp:Transcript_26511/g.74530  ORF Transcript_26511/g.74530 Transcript_26511/m.74530 type:complete len:122 (+) Transcript_26511:434-799(+)
MASGVRYLCWRTSEEYVLMTTAVRMRSISASVISSMSCEYNGAAHKQCNAQGLGTLDRRNAELGLVHSYGIVHDTNGERGCQSQPCLWLVLIQQLDGERLQQILVQGELDLPKLRVAQARL